MVETRLETLHHQAIADATCNAPALSLTLTVNLLGGLVLLGALLISAGCGPPL